MSKNICLVTWYNSINYGTCIQCYALSRFLSMHGYNVYIPETLKYYYGLKNPIETISKILNKIIFNINNPNTINREETVPQNIKKGYKKRKNKNTEFAYNYNQIYHIDSYKSFINMINKTEIFMTGSDQIWNPQYCSPPFLLSFAKKGKKISYASSIGVSEIPSNRKKMYIKYLTKFDYISVREKTAKEVLTRVLETKLPFVDISVVLDPSFLLNEFEWNRIADEARVPREKFVFCYFIGDSKKCEKQINTFAEQKKISVYFALSESNVLPKIGNICADLDVREFIAYIKNAEYIITDSFHAVALSIIFNKNFFVYKRFSDENITSQNSRIVDILTEFGLMDRLIENDIMSIKKYEIDYTSVNLIVDRLRKESVDYLLNSINGC